MNANDMFGQELSSWLQEEGEHRVPDHLREVLVQTAATRQRPWWSSPERWLSVQTTLRFAPMPRIAWLLVVLALILALAATAVLVVGSRPRMPPPFGPAANGLIAYGAADGDLYAIDAVSGTSHPLVTGG